MNGGKNDEGSGHGRQKVAGKQKPAEQALQATQPADSPPGSGLKTHGPQIAGLAAKTQLPMTSASRRAG